MTLALRRWLIEVSATVRTTAGEPISVFDLQEEDYSRVRQLDLSAARLTDVHSDIVSLSNLEVLNLSRNSFTRIPAPVYTLTSLRELQVSRNQLEHLDEEIGSLRQLRGLYASRNSIIEIPRSIGDLRDLRTLNIRNNRLTELPPELYRLEYLDELDVSENGIRELSASVTGLQRMRNFYISGNDLVSLPGEIGDLRALESLAISGNQLASLPKSIAKLGNLKSFWVYDNPLTSPPLEIAVRGIPDIRAYFYALDSGAAQLESRVRILILGPPHAGKTSLVERLTTGRFAVRRRETLGVKISQWATHDATSEVLLWDFGGQNYMHAAHRLFMGGGELYIAVIDVRQGDPAEYWLQLIMGSSPEAQVMVALNKIDLSPGQDVDRRFLSEKYSIIEGYYPISCKTGEGVDHFAARVIANVQRVVDERSRRLSVPVTWALVHDRITNSPIAAITIDGYRELCQGEGCTESEEQNILLQFLRDIGAVVVLDRTRPWTVITNPQWILDGMYAVIASKHARDAEGFVAESAAASILRDLGMYTSREIALVVDALKEYDFALSLPGGMLLIPDLLPQRAPLDISIPEDGVVHHTINVDGDPSFLHSRTLVRLATDVVAPKAWRRGALLESTAVEASALMISDERDRQIRIRCWGPNRISYLGYIRLMVRSVASIFGDIRISEYIPLDEVGVSVEYDEVLGLYLMGERELCVGKAGVRRDIQTLLFGVGNQGGRLLMSGPVFNFDRSAVTFGAGRAFNINSGEMRSVIAQLVHELERSDEPEASELAREISDAALGNDRSRLGTAAEQVLSAFAATTPVGSLATSVLSIVGKLT